MNKKIIISLVAIAVIIPVLGIGMLPDNADEIGKEFAANYPGATIGVHTLEENISEQEEVDRAELIIEGTVIEVKPFWKIIRDGKNPQIYTEYTVKVNDVIKGNTQDENIKVLTVGGQLDGVTSTTEAISMEYDDNIILLLGKDLNSVFGSYYHPISVSKSTYIVEDNVAKNKMTDRNMDKDLLKEKLERLAGP